MATKEIRNFNKMNRRERHNVEFVTKDEEQ